MVKSKEQKLSRSVHYKRRKKFQKTWIDPRMKGIDKEAGLRTKIAMIDDLVRFLDLQDSTNRELWSKHITCWEEAWPNVYVHLASQKAKAEGRLKEKEKETEELHKTKQLEMTLTTLQNLDKDKCSTLKAIVKSNNAKEVSIAASKGSGDVAIVDSNVDRTKQLELTLDTLEMVDTEKCNTLEAIAISDNNKEIAIVNSNNGKDVAIGKSQDARDVELAKSKDARVVEFTEWKNSDVATGTFKIDEEISYTKANDASDVDVLKWDSTLNLPSETRMKAMKRWVEPSISLLTTLGRPPPTPKTKRPYTSPPPYTPISPAVLTDDALIRLEHLSDHQKIVELYTNCHQAEKERNEAEEKYNQAEKERNEAEEKYKQLEEKYKQLEEKYSKLKDGLTGTRLEKSLKEATTTGSMVVPKDNFKSYKPTPTIDHHESGGERNNFSRDITSPDRKRKRKDDWNQCSDYSSGNSSSSEDVNTTLHNGNPLDNSKSYTPAPKIGRHQSRVERNDFSRDITSPDRKRKRKDDWNQCSDYSSGNSSSSEDVNMTLHIGNLWRRATEWEVRHKFSRYGSVIDCRLYGNFAFVTLSEQAAYRAIEEENGSVHHGYSISVNKAKSQGSRRQPKQRFHK